MNEARKPETLNTRAAGIIGLAVLCSRLLGQAREQIFAALFGGGRFMDAFTAAFRIPNLLRDLFAEGALSTAFVTTFSKTAHQQGEDAAWRLANKILTLAVVVLSLITLIGIVASPWIVAMLTPGFDAEKLALTVTLTRIMFPSILLVSLAAVVMGMLNSRNVFGMPALASSFYNLGAIVAGVGVGWWLDPQFGPRALTGLAVGTLVGSALQLAVQLPALRRLGFLFHPDFRWKDAGVRTVLLLMGPSVVAASSTQINVMVNTVFASSFGDGPVFWLSIAFRLMSLPLGLFGVALGTVSLPMLSRLMAAGDPSGFRVELARSIRLSFLMTIPASLGLIMLAEPIISVLYQHGKFTAWEAEQAAGALRWYAAGLCGYAALKVLVNAFYVIDRRKTPMVISIIAIGVNLLVNWIFTFHFGWGYRGLALSTSCLATINFVILYVLMHRHLQHFETAAMLKLWGKALIAGAVLAAICWAGNEWLLKDWRTMHFLPKLAALLVVIVAAGGGFFVCARLLGIPEISTLGAAAQRRLRRQ